MGFVRKGARLDLFVRWMPWPKVLALRTARGAVAWTSAGREPNYPLEDFVRRLDRATPFVDHVARTLAQRRCKVEIMPREIRATADDIARFTRHETDLVLGSSGFGLEVRSRTQHWRKPADFKFPTMFVDTFSGYLAKTKRPLAYVRVSQKTNAIAVIPTFTSNHWTLEKVECWRRPKTEPLLRVVPTEN